MSLSWALGCWSGGGGTESSSSSSSSRDEAWDGGIAREACSNHPTLHCCTAHAHLLRLHQIYRARTTHYIYSGSACLIQPTQDVVPFKTKANSFGAKVVLCHLEFDRRKEEDGEDFLASRTGNINGRPRPVPTRRQNISARPAGKATGNRGARNGPQAPHLYVCSILVASTELCSRQIPNSVAYSDSLTWIASKIVV